MEFLHETRVVEQKRNWGRPLTYAMFRCPYCGQVKEFPLGQGNKNKSCGCYHKLKYKKPEDIRFNSEIHYLGRLCGNGHEYHNTGKSIRYIKASVCVICNSMANQGKRTSTGPGIKHDRSKEVINCKKYLECLDKAARNNTKMDCKNCPDREKNYMDGVWKKEKDSLECAENFDEFTEFKVDKNFFVI